MTLKEVKSSYSKEKRDSEIINLWLYFFGRKLSFPVAWLFIPMGISPSATTFLSILFVLAGAVLVSIGNYNMQILGTVFFNIWVILDCADGTIARCTKSFSKYGSFIDALGGYVTNALVFISFGFLSYKLTSSVLLLNLGWLAAFTAIFSRLLFQKQSNVYEDNTNIKPQSSKSSMFLILAQNLAAVSGFMLPGAVITVILKRPDILVIYGAVVNSLMLLYTLFKTLKKKA